MARRDTSPDFIEALARGLDVIKAFGPRQRAQGRRPPSVTTPATGPPALLARQGVKP
jgi:IclR family pca regulon transcriptional regulator